MRYLRVNYKIKIVFCFLALINCLGLHAQNPGTIKNKPVKNRTITFDKGWFFTHDSTETNSKSHTPSTWRKIDLPHDWSIEDLPGQKKDSISGPFIRTSVGATATGYVQGGAAWYKKYFKTTAPGPLFSIHFDGVYMIAEIWLNGHFIGRHNYGYTPFEFTLNKWLLPAGRENVLQVLVKNPGKNSRWYSGSGIYRHVWLQSTALLHLVDSAVNINTREISADGAMVEIKNIVRNEGRNKLNGKLYTRIISPSGVTVGETESELENVGREDINTGETIEVRDPLLWSFEKPNLYQAVTLISIGNKTIDSISTSFGIRTISLEANKGLTINGNAVKLKGGCIHHDNGPLGAAISDRAEERKIEILKQNGFNAIRTSHNPPSTSLLNACDKLGMLVIDEAFDMWERPKNPDDYHLFFDKDWKNDLDAMILRDRNHPSVIMWSIGNEINERADSGGLVIAARLVKEVKRLDRTRPVTEAICAFWDHPGKSWESTAPAFALLDAGGYNYQWALYEKDHEKYPDRVMVGTESTAREALDNWKQVEKHPYVIGDFVWTAFDYMGETGIGHTILNNRRDSFAMQWPWYDSYCGDIDLTGNKKPQSYYRDIIWGQRKIAMAVHRPIPDTLKEIISYWGWPDELLSWNWNGWEGKQMHVRIYSSSGSVRLLLNNKVIGEEKINPGSITAEFTVPYEAGTLKAIALENGNALDSFELKTTGPPAKIILKADRSVINSSSDLSYVSVEVADKDNNVIPDLSYHVSFSISGNGTLAATGNGDPQDISGFKNKWKNTFNGRCLLIVKPNESRGKIFVNATGDSLQSASISITVQ